MTRPLSGSLKHLTPPALLRLISATGATGSLELVTDIGTVQLEIEQGGVVVPSGEDLSVVGRILDRVEGAYRFVPGLPGSSGEGVTLDASEFMSAAREACGPLRGGFASEVDVDSLIAGEILEMAVAAGRTDIHVLPAEPLENPLDDLLSDLEAMAPEELLLAQVCVVTVDPRPWKGVLDREWRRRGWEVRLFGDPVDPETSGFDFLVVHHQMSITRVGSEEDWIDLVTRFVEARIPVVWVGPMGDPMWVGRLVDVGVSFLLPAPQVEGGESAHRLTGALTTVVERLFRQRNSIASESATPSAVADLVDTLVHGVEVEEILGALLQLAATQLSRGAVFSVEGTAIRCRAGFGYPLVPGGGAVPRGVGLLERVIRTGETLTGIDPDGGGAGQLARALGSETLPEATVVIPLGTRSGVVGLMVGDLEGRDLPDLNELSMLAGRLGGAFV